MNNIKCGIHIPIDGKYEIKDIYNYPQIGQFIASNNSDTFRFTEVNTGRSVVEYAIIFGCRKNDIREKNERPETWSGYLCFEQSFADELMKKPQRLLWLKDKFRNMTKQEYIELYKNTLATVKKWEVEWDNTNENDIETKLDEVGRKILEIFFENLLRKKERNVNLSHRKFLIQQKNSENNNPKAYLHAYFDMEDEQLINAIDHLPFILRTKCCFSMSMDMEKEDLFHTWINLCSNYDEKNNGMQDGLVSDFAKELTEFILDENNINLLKQIEDNSIDWKDYLENVVKTYNDIVKKENIGEKKKAVFRNDLTYMQVSQDKRENVWKKIVLLLLIILVVLNNTIMKELGSSIYFSIYLDGFDLLNYILFLVVGIFIGNILDKKGVR